MTASAAAGTVSVWREGVRVGTLTRTAHGSVFEIDAAWAAAAPPGAPDLAARLPTARGRFETSGVNLHPFFAGLLPEGLRLRALVRATKTSQDDLLTLLAAAGSDTVGDVYAGPGDTEPAAPPPEADADGAGAVSFPEILAASLAHVGGPGGAWSVAGVQPKVSAGRVALRARSRGRGDEWILKLGDDEHPRLVENEAHFLGAARDCGLDVPEFRVVHDRDGRAGLLVRRFDRAAGPGPRRLHAEDACQLLDRYPADKYRLSLRDVAEALADVCAASTPAVAWLVRLHAFSYAIGNGDLHAKNVSVLRDPRSGRHAPAPAYDLVSTVPYGDDRMALAMDGRDRRLRRADFTAFASRHGVRPPATDAMLREVCAGVAIHVAAVERIGLGVRPTAALRRAIAARLDDLAGR